MTFTVELCSLNFSSIYFAGVKFLSSLLPKTQIVFRRSFAKRNAKVRLEKYRLDK